MFDIWKYYNKSSADEAQCQICKRKVARKVGSTRGMWKHLEAKHQQDFKQLKGTLNDRENEEEQRSIVSFVTSKKNEQREAEPGFEGTLQKSASQSLSLDVGTIFDAK
uniref:BED-type domain-containing protein n=1 Tax=Globodera rostochiensis TaxID=31243 RepID=A0A914HUU0_GLORO